MSSGQQMYFDGKIIAARLLVNGKTITQDFSHKAFEYFHIELDHLDIFLAEGAPAESYVDTGHRSMFRNGAIASPDADFSPATGRPKIDGIEIVKSGPTACTTHQRLLERAEIMAQPA